MTNRKALLAAGLIVALIKSIEFALDPQVLFCSDSESDLLNALKLGFVSFRSYVYGASIRAFALPFHSFRAVVAMQMLMGGLTAWLLALALLRFLKVRPWIAILASAVFAIDPVQVLHEHMVMTETAALLVGSGLLLTALECLEQPAMRLLVVASFLGILLVSLRTVYLPVVLSVAVLLPLGCWWPPIGRRRQLVALALAVSCASTAVFHVGYRHLIGRLAWREPAYHYWTGFFLVAAVSPLLEPEDDSDPRVSEAVAIQSTSRLPLRMRQAQLWDAEGLAARLRAVFDGDERKANAAAQRLALGAIRRHPAGYVRLAVRSYLGYWRNIPIMRHYLQVENGSTFSGLLTADQSRAIVSAFGADDSNQGRLQTLTRKYNLLAAFWYVFLLLTPFLTGLALVLNPLNPKAVGLLLVWTCLVIAATCFGTTETVYRYLQPFSFTGLAAVAILIEKMAGELTA